MSACSEKALASTVSTWKVGQFVQRRLDPRQIEVLDDNFAEVLRHKTSSERVAMVLEANRFVRSRLEGQLRTDHPDWTDQQVAAEIARRMLGGTG